MTEASVDKLWNVFENVAAWLKFAEAKHGGLLALNCAIFGASFQIGDYNSPAICFYLLFVRAFSLASVVVNVSSFLPQTKIDKKLLGRSQPSDGDNLFFFGDIAKYSGASYLKAFGLTGEGPTRLEKDLADQIIQVSQIALRKYRYFSFAAWLTVSALLTPVFSLFWYLVSTRNH